MWVIICDIFTWESPYAPKRVRFTKTYGITKRGKKGKKGSTFGLKKIKREISSGIKHDKIEGVRTRIFRCTRTTSCIKNYGPRRNKLPHKT